jgi:hypothetical protein
MRMAIESGRLTVGSPACMRDTSMRIEDLGHVDFRLCNELLQFGDLSHLLESKDFILLVTVDGQTCRVITTVFQTREA